MKFIEDFNTAFDIFIVHIGDEKYDEQKFIQSSYLWVFMGWFLSIIIFLFGNLVKSNTENFTILLLVSIVAFFFKGISDVTSTNSKRVSTFLLISIPFIYQMLTNYNSWIFILALYPPTIMMSKVLQLGIQSKKYNIKDSKIVIYMLISSIMFSGPIYFIFHKNFNYDKMIIISSMIFFILLSVLYSILRDFASNKNKSLLDFSTLGLLVIVTLKEVLDYFIQFIN